MKSYYKILLLVASVVLSLNGCKKNGETNQESPTAQEKILSDNAIVIGSSLPNNSIIAVDSTTLTFNASATGIDKIKVGSVLVSDISTSAPDGFLRKVTSISNSGGNKIFATEQASLTDVIVNGSVEYNKEFNENDILAVDSTGTDFDLKLKSANKAGTQSALSLNFKYNKLIYDADNNLNTKDDQVYIIGEMINTISFNLNIVIKANKLEKFSTKITLKSTNKITAESKKKLLGIKKEIVLKTFVLQPFTVLIAGVPVPIASQWIAIVLGVNGELYAKISAGAQNVSTAVAGIIYENNLWSQINSIGNQLIITPLEIEGNAKIEPWLMLRYEIRPYAVKQSKIYIGIRGSVIGEANVSDKGVNTTLSWGVQLSAKAQMQIWDKTVIDFEQIFFQQSYPFYQSTIITYPTISTNQIFDITETTAKSGGIVTLDGGGEIISRGVCWSNTANPTISDNVAADGKGIGSFTSTLTGLIPNKMYYVRAYAVNSKGVAYGNQEVFVTSQSSSIANVTTTAASDVTATGVTLGGNIIYDGNSTVSERGIVYATTQNPTITNTKVSIGTGTGIFSSSITGLNSNIIYYVKAYAINSQGTVYGNQISFTTLGAITVPILTTTNASLITSNSVLSGGAISSDGGSVVTAKGVCWSTSANPTTSNSKTTEGTGAGNFSSTITGLSSNTPYHVRAYATNSAGTSYGNDITFTTDSSSGGTNTDTDGNTYSTVTIGTQVWMASNLKTTKYNDGTAIPLVTDNTTWSNLSTPGYCWYNNNAAANKDTYGALYNWYTVKTGKLCPAGWHVPGDTEWTTLTTFLGGVSGAGGKLKETGFSHWLSPNTGATNTNGFIALPGGYRYSYGTFNDVGYGGNWWSSTEFDTGTAWYRYMGYIVSYVARSNTNRQYGFSVRCLRDY